eukprot:6359969-Karenia_brevis.AAC.1
MRSAPATPEPKSRPVKKSHLKKKEKKEKEEKDLDMEKQQVEFPPWWPSWKTRAPWRWQR